MDYFITKKINDRANDYQIFGLFSDKKVMHVTSKASSSTMKNIQNSIKNKELTGKVGDYQIFYDSNNEKQKVLLFGLGSKNKLTPNILDASISSAIKKIKNTNAKNIVFNIDNIIKNKLDLTIKSIIISIESSLYKFSLKNKGNKINLKKCYFITAKNISKKIFSDTVKISKSIANGINKTKDLGNLPPNICTPTFLANEAKKLAKINKFIKVDVLDERKMKTLKMGSFLSVAQGSKEPAKLITIKYLPIKNKKPIVLVGKGITFDTGGISIKPSSAMDEMKFDMSGAASVIGTLQACAEMKIKTNVIGILACAENMPGGNASRPGDVVTSMSGITIEILNTDAEGRLVLCDSLTYAKKFSPRYLIDMATLTGACAVALGKYPSGLFTNNQKLADLLKKSGDRTGDRVWQLPLYDDYFDEIKTNFADIQNIGGKYGGAITAAAFLAKFTDDIKWAHLDIAGTAWDVGPNKGSTGRPVGLLTDFLLSNL